MGKDINDKDYADVLMSSLPPSYDTAHSAVNASAHLMQSKITSDTFQAYILNEYELHELRSNKKDAKDKAFTADASKKKPKKDIECHNCHKHGHVKADYWAKGGGKEGQRLKHNDCTNVSMAAVTEEPELGAWAAIQNVEDTTDNDQQNYAAAIAGRSPAWAEQLCGAAELYNSGASQHMSPFHKHFITYQSILPCTITTADKQTFYAIGTGDLQIEVPNSQCITKVLPQDALHTSDMGMTIVSISWITNAGCTVSFEKDACTIRNQCRVTIGVIPPSSNRLYKVECTYVAAASAECINLLMLH